MRVKASMCRSAARSPASPTPPWTASTCPLKSLASAKSSSMPSHPAWLSPSQISKTLQANMEGDGIGGSVNLITKEATDTPTFEITGLGGFTSIQGGRGNTTETATFGRRFGASKKFGVIVGGSYDWEGRASTT